MRNIQKILAAIILCLVLAAMATGCFLLKNDSLDRLANDATQAFIDRDAEKLGELIHPDCLEEMGDISDAFQELEDAGIDLQGEIEALTVTGRRYETDMTGKMTQSVYSAVIGGEKYTIEMRTLNNDSGFGITTFYFYPEEEPEESETPL